MENPWKELITENKTFLKSDKKKLEKIKGEVIFKRIYPEPYIGNPEAPIVLLNLNPGYSEIDHDFYKIKRVYTLWRKNITHKIVSSQYPFYFIDPKIRVYAGGPCYWRKLFKKLIDDTNLTLVAKKIFCVEYFPYHSKTYKNSFQVPSQKYSFSLVEQAITNKALIIILRSEKLWFKSIQRLEGYENRLGLNSKRNVILTENNITDNGYMRIIKILKNN